MRRFIYSIYWFAALFKRCRERKQIDIIDFSFCQFDCSVEDDAFIKIDKIDINFNKRTRTRSAAFINNKLSGKNQNGFSTIMRRH